MKKVLALILAVAMLMTGNVVALAADSPVKDSGVTLSKTAITVEVGKSFVLLPTATPEGTNWDFSWTSDKPEVVEVDQDGIVTGKTVGTATVTVNARIKGNPDTVSAVCTVTVVTPGTVTGTAVTRVDLNMLAATVNIGKTTTLTATVSPANATNKTVIWSSSDEDIATVDQNGTVTGVSAGETKIRATSEDGNLWDECKMTVEEEDEWPIRFGFWHAAPIPEEIIDLERSINSERENGYAYYSSYRPLSITFQNKLITGTIGEGMFWLEPTTPRNNASDVGTVLEDKMVVSLSDGKDYTFNIKMAITDDVELELKEGHSILMGEPATLKLTIKDAANIAKKSDTIKITQGNGSDEDILTIGEAVVNGKEISIPVTPLKLGSIDIRVDLEYADGMKQCGLSWILDVVKEKPSTPVTPGSFNRDTGSKDEPTNEANSGSTLVAIAAANDALSTGKAMPGKVQNVTIASGASVPAVPVKLYGLNASISVGTMELLAQGKVGMKVNLDNGAAEIIIPGGFPMPAGTGILGYSLGWQKDPLNTNLMKDAVKEESAKTEVYKLGGGALPTTATLTLKTKLTGKVNVYYWNEDTRRATLVASPTADDGKVTFAAKTLGNFILTTGTI